MWTERLQNRLHNMRKAAQDRTQNRMDGFERLNEHSLRGRLVRVTVGTIVVGVMLIACSGMIINTIIHAQQSTYKSQLNAMISERQINMEREFAANLRSLEMLSALIGNADLAFSDIVHVLEQASTSDQMLRIGYYGLDGIGMHVTANGEIETGLNADDLSTPLRWVVEQAWQEEEVVSDVFFDSALQTEVLAYGVPVYDASGQIRGALGGLEELEVFQYNVIGDTTNKNIQIQWVNRQGEYIMWTPCSKESSRYKETSIFGGNYLTQEQKDLARRAMANEHSYHTEFLFEDTKHPLYFVPLNQHGWYLVCIDWSLGMDDPIYPLILVTTISLSMLVVLCISWIIYAYRALCRNNRDLIQLAYYDKLTGSYNFSRFQQVCVEAFRTERDYSITVFNIRRFQYINEIFGRDEADRLLCEITNKLDNMMIAGEAFCRYTGDQFYILLRGVDQAAVQKRLFKFMGEISSISHRLGRNFPIILYAGVAISKPEIDNEVLAKTLIHQAEFALKHTHVFHENTIAFYNDAMHADDAQQNNIEDNMQFAIQNGEFRLWLQPKFDLARDCLCGAEALVRWIRPDGVILYPGQFIPLFEHNGFCVQFDLYMVAQVCARLRRWMDAGIEIVPISVNQSKLLFYQTDYVQRLCEITDYYQIPRNMIMLEILEGLAAESIDVLNYTIERLHHAGFHLSLDDFGSGYSSLNILAQLSIDEVKLDRGFLVELDRTGSEKHYKLMRHIVNLARDLGMRTVIEGVETEENESLARKLGCDIGQGYYYSKPISVAAFEQKYFGIELG